METLDTQSWIILAAVVALGLVAIGAWFYRRKQSHNLQERFGPEYGRTVSELGGRTKGESELKAREKRVERLDILPLAPPEAARFTEAWRALQSRFIDNPKGVVVEAEQLVRELMGKRGYPMGDFERRAGDISVDHPDVWQITERRRPSLCAISGDRRTPRSCAGQLYITAPSSMSCSR